MRALLAAVAVLLATAGTAQASGADAIKLVDTKQLTPRLSELTLQTPALAQDTHVRILLPEGYDPSAHRYPVLYLLHGCCDDYRSWSDKGDVEKIVGSLPLIVVMPDGGQGGFYSDWYNNGAGGPPEWESYHVGQLIPWIDRHYATDAARRARAIAGLSMGGFGTMSYAARHPGLFSAAASFSGAVDTNDGGGTGAVLAGPLLDSHPDGSVFGPRQTQEVRWRGHNPYDLAENLRGMNLTVRTGNGQPGGPYGGGDPIEAGVHTMSTNFHNRLDALGIPHVWDDYGPGGHDWPYWQRDLRETLPAIMGTFASRPAVPRRFAYSAIEPGYRVYGWRVRIDRPALEFSRLASRGRRGFTLAGRGTAQVVTARLYRPRKLYRVTVGRRVRLLRAGRRGRLSVPVPLGPANGAQQYTVGSDTAVFTTRVTVRRARG